MSNVAYTLASLKVIPWIESSCWIICRLDNSVRAILLINKRSKFDVAKTWQANLMDSLPMLAQQPVDGYLYVGLMGCMEGVISCSVLYIPPSILLCSVVRGAFHLILRMQVDGSRNLHTAMQIQ